jgi:hypothetical protein
MIHQVGQWLSRRLTTEANRRLAEPITLRELKKSFDKGPRNKAPRSHGTVHEFYIHFWGVIKTDLLTTHNSILRNKFPPSGNLGTIACAPKCPLPRTMSDYRALMLLNTDDKIYGRVLVQRLSTILGDNEPSKSILLPMERNDNGCCCRNTWNCDLGSRADAMCNIYFISTFSDGFGKNIYATLLLNMVLTIPRLKYCGPHTKMLPPEVMWMVSYWRNSRMDVLYDRKQNATRSYVW